MNIAGSVRRALNEGGAMRWLNDFKVSSIPEIAESPAFKAMLDYPDFKSAHSFYISSSNMLIVIGDGQYWGWEEVGGNCMLNGTTFPVSGALSEGARKISRKTRDAILSKNKNHVFGDDGFCLNCKDMHRTDWRQNDLCPKLFKP